MGRRFEDMLEATKGSRETWRAALATVGDTALICRALLEEFAHPITAADIVAMPRIVVERETAMVVLAGRETKCGTKPQNEPTALHELLAVLEYAVGLDAARGSSVYGYNGFMECRRMMIRAIEFRLQAFD